MNPLLGGMLLSLLPISELRGGIPFSVFYGVDPIVAFIFCSLANILVVPLCFLFLDSLNKVLLKIKFYRNAFGWYIEKIRKRKEKVERAYQTYGPIALTIFVAIPLPITGAWTGTLVAWLLGLKRARSFFAIALGVLVSGIIVLLIVKGILAFRFLF